MIESSENILFLCNTYMQLITAIQIRRMFFPEARVNLLISDHSVMAEKVCSNIQKMKIFDQVKAIKTKHFLFGQNKLSDLVDIIQISFGLSNKYRQLLFEDNLTYDRIFYYNYDFVLYAALDLSVKNGKVPALCRFEEGIHSCANMLLTESEMGGRRLKIIYKVRKRLHRRCIFDITNDFYVFFDRYFPETDRTIHSIPKLSRQDSEMVLLLNKCFGYIPENDIYEQKYIFFGSSRDMDGYQTEEMRVVLWLADIVGRNNLLIKMHPRDNRNLYGKHGINVGKNSNVPWELIQMNHDFSEHVFITMGSGSVIAASALLGDQIETYLLYPLDKGKDKKYDQYCEKALKELLMKLQSEGLCLRHRIVEQTEEMRIIFLRHEGGCYGTDKEE